MMYEKKKGVENIKNIIGKVIGDISQSNISKQEKLEKVWNRIMAEDGYRSVQLAGMKDNQVTVYVDSSARLYEMNLRKKNILTKIKNEIPDIEKVYFKIGKVT